MIFTFETTHHALWAEEIAGEEGIPVEAIPAPAHTNAKCNLALETFAEEAVKLEVVLTRAEIPHTLHRPLEG